MPSSRVLPCTGGVRRGCTPRTLGTRTNTKAAVLGMLCLGCRVRRDRFSGAHAAAGHALGIHPVLDQPVLQRLCAGDAQGKVGISTAPLVGVPYDLDAPSGGDHELQ